MGSTLIDSNEADLVLLEENLKTTNALSEEIARSLMSISKMNAQSIEAIQPLMGKINYLKITQTNIGKTMDVMSSIKAYAKRAHDIQSDLHSCAGLKDSNMIQMYTQHLARAKKLLQELHGDGGSTDLSDFKGITRGLNDAVEDAERNFRISFEAKVVDESKIFNPVDYIKSNQAFPRVKPDRLKELVLMIQYLEPNSKKMAENLSRLRGRYILEILKNTKFSTKNFINSDPSYFYGKEETAISGPDFEMFSNTLIYLIRNEYVFFNDVFKNSSNDPSFLLYQTLSSPLDYFEKTLNEVVSFVDSKKYNYGPMLFEISASASKLERTVNKYSGNKISQSLELTISQLENNTKSLYGQFFDFMSSRYSSDQNMNSEGFNTTFLNICTRLRKFTIFKDSQLASIEKCTRGSWLPTNRPSGFEEQKIDTKDPQFLLSCFYSDAIVMNYAYLEGKFKSKLPEDDLGLMLLYNLDGLQTIIDKSEDLQTCLGQPGLARYKGLKKNAMNKCMSQWQDMTKRLMEAAMVNGVSGHSAMSSKEMGKLIEDFNKNFEDNFKKISNKNLPEFFKTTLIGDISKTLVPAYRAFHGIVSKDSSMKNAMKHFKYDPAAFSNKMRTLG